MDNKKVLWIDSNWDVFSKMILSNTIPYLWKNGIDSNVLFINSYDNDLAYLLETVMFEEFIKVYNAYRKNNENSEYGEFLENKYMEILKHNFHFDGSAIIPFHVQFDLYPIIYRIKENKNRTFIMRMDLLEGDRIDLVDGKKRLYLSMEVYNYIVDRLNLNCILFAEDDEKGLLKKNWEEIYKSIFEKKSVKDPVLKKHL